MRFPRQLGVIACRCVVSEGKRVHLVSHAGGDWQMYCSGAAHDFQDPAVLQRDLTLVEVARLVAVDRTLEELADLPVDMGAERDSPASPWLRFADRDADA